MSEKGSRDEVNAGSPSANNVPVVAKLCYVDDSRTSAYVVRRLLQPLGYKVEHFASAEPAFVALVQDEYDLLLTDLKVSPTGMDGDDLIRTLRQSGHPKLSKLPIIVITGATDAEALVKVYDVGANQVMKKPVEADELDGHIRRLLSDDKKIDPEITEAKPSGFNRRSSDATVVPLHPAQSRTVKPSSSAQPDTQAPLSETEVPVSSKTEVPVLNNTPSDVRATPKDKPASPVQGNAPAAKSTPDDDSSSILRAMEKESAAVTTQPEAFEAAEPIADNKQKTTDTGGEQDATEFIAEPGIVVDPDATASSEVEEEEVVIIEPDMRADRNARSTQAGKDENILDEIEQYPLVSNPRKSLFSSSYALSLVHSLVELVGIRSLLVRALGAGIALLVVLAAWNTYFNQGLPVDTVFVESGEIFQSVTVPGRIVSKQRVNISSARAGRLVKVMVKEGDKVKKGQVLAKIDDRELLSRLNRAKANLSAAREDISLAERTLKRLRKAHAKGAVARRFVEDAEVDLRAARTKAGIVVEEVRSATLEFDNQKVAAPFAGTVTSRFAEIGQWVGPTETLFTLVDESQREIEARVDAADSVAIDVGQVVAVSSDAFPGLEWQESVVRLGAAAGSKRNANSVKVYISLGNDAPVFRYGQQVDADIRTAWNPNALKIPFEALISRDGQTMVAVLEGGKVRMKIVETGIEDFSMAEIKQGLNAGEMVILSKGKILQNGDRVYPKRASK